MNLEFKLYPYDKWQDLIFSLKLLMFITDFFNPAELSMLSFKARSIFILLD